MSKTGWGRKIAIVLVIAVPLACGIGRGVGAGKVSVDVRTGVERGATSKVTGPPDAPVEYAALRAKVDKVRKLSRAEVTAAYPAAFEPLSYRPLEARNLDRIQSSSFALSPGESEALKRNGFVISTRRQFPTFVRGFAEIYAIHLPVFISADAILETVHSSYDQILLALEYATLMTDVRAVIDGMRTNLATSTADAAVRADVDLYLAVAFSLLQNEAAPPVAGADAAAIAGLFQKAVAARGTAKVRLFGVVRDEDLSQFKPRGHYAGPRMLEAYFRAMMWLGRIDFRLVETESNGEQVFRRPQYDAMLLMRALADDQMERWSRIDAVLSTFVGASDSMTLPEVDRLIADLGGSAAARTASDDAVEKALRAGGYGQQRIASHLMVNDGRTATLPLSRSFLLLGQRYTVDSNVLSAVVYDRVENRLMPSPMDAAFAALGNNQALALVPDLNEHRDLPGALAGVRTLVDSNGETFWSSSFYNLWLSSLRALSPDAEGSARRSKLPQVARTEAWGRRLLNTQLASWAELRHDTILYAKQSYTGSILCEFPDAYVDPYPEAFAALHRYAEHGLRLAAIMHTSAGGVAKAMERYYANLASTTAVLEGIASRELSRQELTQEQREFIDRTVRIREVSMGCTSQEIPDGWLPDLYFEPDESVRFAPTIADVHTQPVDADGSRVGRVLHVGTGFPRLMVVTADSCGGGPRAYAGVVFSYHETITTNFERLQDFEWMVRFHDDTRRPEDVGWARGILAH